MTAHVEPIPANPATALRRSLVAIELIVAASAVGGAIYAFGDAPEWPREWLEGTPFHSYVVPGLILLVAVGGGMAAAAAALLVRHPRAPELSIAAGAVLVGWIAGQVLLIVPEGGFSWLQPVFLAVGAIVVALGLQLRGAPARPAAAADRPRTVLQASLGSGLLALGAGLAVLAALGPLLTGAIDYRVTETFRNQTIGLDAVSLVLVAPLALLAGALVLRGNVAGPALALGIGAFTAYMQLQYVLGPDYGLEGNNALLFPLCLVLFALGWLVAVGAWNALGPEPLPGTRRRDRLVGRAILPGLAFLAFVRYLPLLPDTMSSTPEDAGYLAGPTFFWAIALMDLGIFLPATVLTCVGLVRGSAWARKALYTVAGWFALVGPAVAAMAVVMYVNDDPNASGASVAFMVALGLLFAVLAAALLQPLVSSARKGAPR